MGKVTLDTDASDCCRETGTSVRKVLTERGKELPMYVVDNMGSLNSVRIR